MVPFPPSSCSKAVWCSLLGYAAPKDALSALLEPKRTVEKEKCSCPSHRRTPAALDRALGLSSPAMLPSRTRPVPPPPQFFFSRESHPLQEPPDSRVAKVPARVMCPRNRRLSETDAAGR